LLPGHEFRVSFVAFSRDGTKVISGSWDRTARIWPVDGDGAPLVLRGHTNTLTSVAFGPDGLAVSASNDGTARVWDGPEGTVLRGHTDAVVSAAFSPDGTRILTASTDGTARIWLAPGQGSLSRAQLRAASSVCLTADQRVRHLGEDAATALRRWHDCEWQTGRSPRR
jgi:WD40 repeat protein